MGIQILFSDIDGTCVHYPGVQALQGALLVEYGCLELSDEQGLKTHVLQYPPSSSGSVGIISVKTLELYAKIRGMGIKLVFISGARFSTLAQRLPYLPAADAYVCESGGRIFFADDTLPTAAALREDFEWRKVHEAATGPCFQDSIPPCNRSGTLWEFYSHLVAQGVNCDASSYTTAFRVREPLDKRAAVEKDLPQSLVTAVNLGAADVYPATSGKANAARYLMERYGCDTDGSTSIFMCGELRPRLTAFSPLHNKTQVI